jgi:hypothetical protein
MWQIDNEGVYFSKPPHSSQKKTKDAGYCNLDPHLHPQPSTVGWDGLSTNLKCVARLGSQRVAHSLSKRKRQVLF